MCLNETESVYTILNYVLFTQYHKQERCYFEYQHDCENCNMCTEVHSGRLLGNCTGTNIKNILI